MGGNECFQLATTVLGGEGGQRDEPKVDQKIVVRSNFFVYSIMALNVIKFLTETSNGNGQKYRTTCSHRSYVALTIYPRTTKSRNK